MIFRPEARRVGLLVYRLLVARRAQVDALAPVQHIMAEFVSDGEGAHF